MARNTGVQQSSRLKSIQNSNGLILIERGSADKKLIKEGEEVECLLIGNIISVKNSNELANIKTLIKSESHSGEECCSMRHNNNKYSSHSTSKRKFSLGYVIVSDRASRGEYKDEGGPALEEFFTNLYDSSAFEIKEKIVIPDEKELIEKTLIEMVDKKKLDLIFTSGGTGLSKRDVTPEATLNVINKEATGISKYIMAESIKITKMACLSRGVAGIRNETLIINLPGNPKAVKENLNILQPVLKHALNQICQVSDFH